MGRATGSWLSGPQFVGGEDNEFRGQDLGLPEAGRGALAGGWRRVLGMLIDWLIAYGVAMIVVPPTGSWAGTIVLAIWFVMGLVSVTAFGFTPGQWAAGIRVARVDFGAERNASEAAGTEPPAAVGFVRAVGRQVLVSFAVPALINDYNGRAMHDRATGTALVCTR